MEAFANSYENKAFGGRTIIYSSLYNLEQLIDQPTRITENSTSLINLTFANSNHRIISFKVLHVNLSDHSLIDCVVSWSTQSTRKRTYSKQSFLAELSGANFKFINDGQDIDIAVSINGTNFSLTLLTFMPQIRNVRQKEFKPFNSLPI